MNEYSPEVNALDSPTLGKASEFPTRDDQAMTGSQFGKSVIGLLGQARDNKVIEQVLAGNVPSAVRNFRPITLMSGGNTLQYWVSGDVLSVGSDSDYLRVSLNGRSARSLLSQFNCILPTKKMSDDIWRSADLRLNPEAMGASASMTNTQVMLNHNGAINIQLKGREFNLLTGHKKDVILAKSLLKNRDRLSIYGWFYKNGVAIQGPQPNSSHHDILYQDYSHGIRLVKRSALLQDQPVDLLDVLNHPQFAYLLSEEGSYDGSSIYF